MVVAMVVAMVVVAMRRPMHARDLVVGALGLAATVAACACKDDVQHRGAATDASPRITDADSAKRKRPPDLDDDDAPPLLADLELAPLGARPGHVEGGATVVSLRAAATQAWLRSLPWPPDAEREAARAAAEIGFDPLAADWLSHFAIPDDAVVSATLLRPIDDGVADARARMEEIATPLEDGTRSVVEVPVGGGEIVEPARPSTATIDAVRTASRSLVRGAALHSRIHVPSRDPARTRAAIVGMFGEGDRTRGAEACAGVSSVDACVAESTGVLALREREDAVVVDFLRFAIESSGTEGARAWKPALEAAIAVEPAEIEPAAAMGGDAAMWLDPAVLARVHTFSRVSRAIEAAEWGATDWPADLGWQLGRDAAFASLAAAPRLFPGVRVEAVAQGKDLHAQATWPVTGPLWGRMGASMIEPPPATSPVPTIEALCDGAILCFRTRGVPDLRALSRTLATEGFGGDFEDVIRRLEATDELGFGLLAGGAWANLLAAGATFPDAMKGTEAGIARTVRDAVMRAEGFGGSVRNLTLTGFFRFESDYVLYTRAKGSDVGAAAGLVALSGEPTREIELSDGRGKATVLDTRAQSPRAQVVLRKEEGDDAAGWVALADGPDRVSWLLALPTESPGGPVAYLELPDLLAIVVPLFGDDRTIDGMRGWLRNRRLRAVFELADGGPRLRASLTGPH